MRCGVVTLAQPKDEAACSLRRPPSNEDAPADARTGPKLEDRPPLVGEPPSEDTADALIAAPDARL
jgi:hypothetical protein